MVPALMTTRRGFFASLAAVLVTPKVVPEFRGLRGIVEDGGSVMGYSPVPKDFRASFLIPKSYLNPNIGCIAPGTMAVYDESLAQIPDPYARSVVYGLCEEMDKIRLTDKDRAICIGSPTDAR